MERWEGKIALVTGASAGIGAAITEELARAGVKVFGLARRVGRVEEIQRSCKNIKGEIIPLKGDISKESDIIDAFKKIRNQCGTIHILVNNAGIARIGNLSEGDPKLFRQIFDVNVHGLLVCTQQALKLMKDSGVDDGHIIHINSLLGHTVDMHGNPTYNVYPASKYSVTALTESLRQELVFLKSKIRVTSISPGLVESEIFPATVIGSGMSPEVLTRDKSMRTMREEFAKAPSLKPKDIADAVLYVLSTPPRVQIHELTVRPTGDQF